MPRIVLTGATGFIGSAIVMAVQHQGIPFTAVGGPSSREAGMATADVTDPSSLDAPFSGADVLVHAAGLAHLFGRAARDAERFEDTNVRGTENTVRAAMKHGLKHIVLLSSVSVYGRHDVEAVNEHFTCAPREAYAVSKLQAEHVARDLAGSSIGLTILRLSTVYGVGDSGNIARLIDAIRRRRFILIGRGDNRKTLIYKDDAARACLVAALSRLSGTYNVCGGVYAIADIVAAIGSAAGVHVHRFGVPDVLLRRAARLSTTVRKFISNDVYDGSRFAAAMNFSPTVGLVEGMRRQVAAM